MANQNYLLDLEGFGTLRVIAVDSAGGANTFTDFGAATSWPAPKTVRIKAVRGQGTTAPATAVTVQIAVNGNQLPYFLNLAAIYDPTSNQADRLGGAMNAVISQGSILQLTSR